jgi:hypothetical protein
VKLVCLESTRWFYLAGTETIERTNTPYKQLFNPLLSNVQTFLSPNSTRASRHTCHTRRKLPSTSAPQHSAEGRATRCRQLLPSSHDVPRDRGGRGIPSQPLQDWSRAANVQCRRHPPQNSPIGAIPSCVALGAPATGAPRVFIKMTSNVCCDDVWWCSYPGTSQRNHDHQCSNFKVARLSGTCVHSAKVFGCKLIAALSSSKRHFSGILRLRKRWLLCFPSFLRPSWL